MFREQAKYTMHMTAAGWSLELCSDSFVAGGRLPQNIKPTNMAPTP